MKKLLLISIAILGVAIATAQAQITFRKNYSDSGYDHANCVRQCSDKGYIILGSSQYAGGSNFEISYLMKTDSIGNTLWSKYYSAGYGSSIEETFDHGFILLNISGTVIHTDSVGEIKWTKQIQNGYARTVFQTADSGYVIAGGFQVASGNEDIFLLKIKSNGDSLWKKTYGDVGFDVVQDMKSTKDNGFVLAGYSDDLLSIIKVNASGDMSWSKKYNQGLKASSIDQTSDNGFIVLGDKYGMLLMKIDSSGNVKWDKILNAFYGSCVIETKDKGLFITGDNFYCVKTDALGNLLWERKLGIGSFVTSGYSRNCVQTNDDGFAVVGHYRVSSPRDSILLVKMDSTGCVRPSIQQINGPHDVTVNTSISFTTILNSGTDSLHFKWTTSYGKIQNGQGTNSITVLWDKTGTDSLLLVIDNSCGTDTLYYPINIHQCVIPLADSIHGSYMVGPYTNTPNYYVNEIQGTNPITYTWSSNVVKIVSGNGTNRITVRPLYNGKGLLTVVCSNSCGTDTLTKKVLVMLNDIHEINENQFSISPNPFSTQAVLHADIPLHNAILTIYNCFGQTVKEIKNISEQTLILDRDNLPCGLYFLNLVEGEKMFVNKLMINDN
jgi:hypothetical protein